MRSHFCPRCVLAVVLVIASTPAFAQQASVRGTITDETKGILPGVAVTATNLATGAQAVDVSDVRGEYRLLNLQPGRYKIEAELAGFASVVVPTIELLVGQNATLPLSLQLATLTETVTVEAGAAFVDTTSTKVAGNIDPRQMEAIPLNGGNWMELAKNIKGISANVITNTPVRNESIQLNLDGQQVTTKLAAFQQGKLSREAIAEFQVVTTLFDITQGRSDRLQVNAISRSGTNQSRATLFGFFRDDNLNAADALTHTVLPYQNQQVGGSLGGAIVRDKLHYFGATEYEREPGTVIARPSALPGQVYQIDKKDKQLSNLGRVDYQPSTRDRLTVRFTTWDTTQTPVTSTGHPSTATGRNYHTRNVLATWARVSSTKVQEFKFGYYNIWWDQLTPMQITPDAFEYRFPGLMLGKPNNAPQTGRQYDPSARYDLSWHRDKHDMKIGAEFIFSVYRYFIPTYREGAYTFSTLPADITARIPVDAPYDPSRWNLTGLDSTVQFFQRAFDPGDFQYNREHPTWALWMGDTWRASNALTVNYGVRWDVIWNSQSFKDTRDVPAIIDNGSAAASTDIPLLGPGNFGYQRGPQNLRDISPRAGFAWNVGGSNTFVIRGGSGLYYSQAIGDITNQMKKGSRWILNSYSYDGRPGFLQDPTRGITTYEQAAAAPPRPQVGTVLYKYFKVPYTWQSSLGFQKQLNEVTGVDVDFVHWNMYRDTLVVDPNLFYDPVTTYNKNPSVFGRPNPGWGEITYYVPVGRQDYTAVLSSINRRLHNRVQGGLSHTWVLSAHDTGSRAFSNPPANNQFDYVEGEYARSSTQTTTVRAWAAADLPHGFSASVQYSYGSGDWLNATIATRPFGKPGDNRLNLSATGGPVPAIVIPEDVRDRWDGADVIESGAVIPRNALKGFSFQQVDVRVSKLFTLPGNLTLSLMGEAFNVFNRANYSAANTLLNPTSAATNARFGQPSRAYIPRQGQLGFRLGWK